MKKRPFMTGYRTYDTSRGYGSRREWRSAFAERMGLDEASRLVGSQTPASILGVSSTATWDEIKTAYRAKAMACHPDRCAQHGLSEMEATERFKRVTAAFTVLEHRRR